MTALDFNKQKVEKAAKAKERSLLSSLTTDNKSVIRAIARYEAAKETYPDAGKDQLLAAIVDAWYKTAKYQPSWDAPFEKHAPELGTKLKSCLGTPSPRGRRSKAATEPPPPASDHPDAVLGEHKE